MCNNFYIISARSSNHPIRRLIWSITLISFLFNTVSYDLALAARDSLANSTFNSVIVNPDEVGAEQSNHKSLSVSTFSLPEYLGHVKDSWQGAETAPLRIDSPHFPVGARSPRPIVIHLQDAHCNYYAQHKISEIIEYLNREYGIDTINLEGGARDYDLSIFTDIKDKDIRKKVSDYFVKEGLVNGAEYFAINNTDKNITLWGVEDTKLYIDNLNVYRESLKHKDYVDKALNTLTNALNELKTKTYSKELLELDTKYSQYKAGTLEFKDYLALLLSKLESLSFPPRLAVIPAQAGIHPPRGKLQRESRHESFMDARFRGHDTGSDIKAQFPNTHLLSQALEMEKGIDFKRADGQRDNLIDVLHKKLSKKSLEELVVKTVEFKSEKISQKEFYEFLIFKVKLVNISQSEFFELLKYIAYISTYSKVDKLAAMDELNELEERVKESLCRNDDERRLNKLSKNLAILKNIFNITLTKEDYKYYLDNKESFDILNYASFIRIQGTGYRVQGVVGAGSPRPNVKGAETAPLRQEIAGADYSTLDKDSINIDRYRENIAKFYEYSFKRDRAFLKNLNVGARSPRPNVQGAETAPLQIDPVIPANVGIHDRPPNTQYPTRNTILITGGFHTENLAELFRKEGVSYISILPNFKNGSAYESPYYKILSGEKTLQIREALPSVLSGLLAIPDPLCPAMGRAMDDVPPISTSLSRPSLHPWQKKISRHYEDSIRSMIRKRLYLYIAICIVCVPMFYQLHGLNITVGFFTTIFLSSYLHELGHWLPTAIIQHKGRAGNGERTYKRMKIGLGYYLPTPMREFSMSIGQNIDMSRGGYVANFILSYISFSLLVMFTRINAIVHPGSVLSVDSVLGFVFSSPVTSILAIIALVNLAGFISNTYPIIPALKGMADGTKVAKLKNLTNILEAAKGHYRFIPEDTLNVKIEIVASKNVYGAMLKSDNEIYLVSESRKRRPRDSISFIHIARSVNYLPFELKGELVRTSEGRRSFRFKNEYYSVYKVMNFPPELAGITPITRQSHNPFRFPKYIWDVFKSKLEAEFRGDRTGIVDIVKHNGLAWTDGDGNIHWIDDGEVWDAGTGRSIRLDDGTTKRIWELAKDAINKTYEMRGSEKRIADIQQVKDVIGYHEELHAKFRDQKYKALIASFKKKLESEIYPDTRLTENHPFIQSFKDVYGEPHGEVIPQGEKTINWYLEEFLVLSLQENRLFGDPTAVIERMRTAIADVAISEDAAVRLAGAISEVIEEDILRDRIKQLESTRQKIKSGDISEIISFGDKHGESEDLRIILNKAKGAADKHRKLVIVGHGDVFDRGQNNFRNFKILQELKRIADNSNGLIELHLCLGNHEVAMLRAVLLEKDTEALISWSELGGGAFGEELGITGIRGIASHEKIRELALWVLSNYELFYVDEIGYLHIHTGIPADADGNPSMTMSDLASLQSRFRTMQEEVRNGRIDQDSISRLLSHEARAVHSTKRYNWLTNLMRERDIVPETSTHGSVARLDNYLARLGVNGVVFGHIHQKKLLNFDIRMFCVDVEDGDAGHLIFNRDGIRFKGIKRDPDDVIANKDRILRNIDGEINRLKRRLGEAGEEGDGSALPSTSGLASSLIGKLLDESGNIATSFNVVQQSDGKAIFIQHDGNTLATVPVDGPLGGEAGEALLRELKRSIEPNISNLPDHMRKIAADLNSKIDNVGEIVVLRRHETVKGAVVLKDNGKYTLYLNKAILKNPLALIHELGEGVATPPEGYKSLTRHTLMRGVGKDVRRAFDAIQEGDPSASPQDDAGGLIGALEKKMKELGFATSGNRTRDGPIADSEKDLIRWNYANGAIGQEALFGVQDFLNAKDNAALSGDIRDLSVKHVSVRSVTTQPNASVFPKDPSLRALLLARMDQLEATRQKIAADDLPDIINFGDKHGKSDDLEDILEKAQKAESDKRKLTIIGHGDVFDYGEDNRRNFEILVELKQIAARNENIEVHLCLGNHEVMMIWAVLLGGGRDAYKKWNENGGTATQRQLGKSDLKKLALWVLSNFELFYVDMLNYLHLHAGIPADANGNPSLTMKDLRSIQAEFEKVQTEAKRGYVDQIGIGRLFFGRARPLYETKKDKWISSFAEIARGDQVIIDDVHKAKLFNEIRAILRSDASTRGRRAKHQLDSIVESCWAEILMKNEKGFRDQDIDFKIIHREPSVDVSKLDEYLARLGANGVVFGHIHLDRLLNLDNRVFCVDVDERDAGHLIIGRNGIRFKGIARDTDDVIATKDEMLANIDAEIARIRQRLGEGTALEKRDGSGFHERKPGKTEPSSFSFDYSVGDGDISDQPALPATSLSAREILDGMLRMHRNHTHAGLEKLPTLRRQLAAKGDEAISLARDVLNDSENEKEKELVMEAMVGITDPQVIDVLANVLVDGHNHSDIVLTIAFIALERFGKEAVSPYIKTLLRERGPKKNILIMISRLDDVGLVPILKEVRTDDEDVKRGVAALLLKLGDKDGLIALIDMLTSAAKRYSETRDEASQRRLRSVSESLRIEKNRARAILREEPVLEHSLVRAVSAALDTVKDDQYTRENLIELLGTGGTDEAARALSSLYNRSANQHEKMLVIYAMRDIGKASVPYLAGMKQRVGIKRRSDLICEVLGIIGDVRAVPALIQDYKRAKAGDTKPRRTIREAVRKIGEKAIPHLMQSLETEKGDNRYLCRLLSGIGSPGIISGLTELAHRDISHRNRMNIIALLARMESRGRRLTAMLNRDPALKKRLFDIVISSLGKRFPVRESEDMTIVLRAASLPEDSPRLIELCDSGNIGTKSMALAALAECAPDEAINILLDSARSSDQSILNASQEAVDILIRTGRLRNYFETHPDEGDELASAIENRAQKSAPSLSLLEAVRTERRIQIFIDELDREVSQSGRVNQLAIELLIDSGEKARAVLIADHAELVRKTSKAMIKFLLEPYDESREAAKNSMAGLYKRWLVFIDEIAHEEQPSNKDELAKLYIAQRIKIADLIIKIKRGIANNPDARYDEMMAYVSDDLEELSPPARARFTVGIINYIRDREKVRKIGERAARAGIVSGDILKLADIRLNRKKANFVASIVGFLPAQVKITFLADTIYVALDSESYGRFFYRLEGYCGGRWDGYSKLTVQQRRLYQRSRGAYGFDYGGRVSGIRLTRLLSLERADNFSHNDNHTLLHEHQHRFFHAYANELKHIRSSHKAAVDALVCTIDGQSGRERKRAVEQLISEASAVVMYHFQDEMLAIIACGGWPLYANGSKLSEWFNDYKIHYLENMKTITNIIGSDGLRQDIVDKIFGRAWNIITSHKDKIDRIIQLKAQLIERDEGIDQKAALHKANEWTAAFLQTIPFSKLGESDSKPGRLDWLVSRLEDELKKTEPSPFSPTTSSDAPRRLPRLSPPKTSDSTVETMKLPASSPRVTPDEKQMIRFIDRFISTAEDYSKTHDISKLTVTSNAILLYRDQSDAVRALLGTDPLLEERIVNGIRLVVDSINDRHRILLGNMIKILGLGSSDASARVLWELYKSANYSRLAHYGYKSLLERAIRDVGKACVPYLIKEPARDDAMIGILGDIGDASAVPALVNDFRVMGSGDEDRRLAIRKAVEKIGQGALPHLLERLYDEKGNNRYICQLLVGINPAEVVPAMVAVSKNGVSDQNRLNIIEALADLERAGLHLTAALRRDPSLRASLFDLAVSSLNDDLAHDYYYIAIERVLKAAAVDNEDVRRLMGIYAHGGIAVKTTILGSLSSGISDEAISFLIGELAAPEPLVVDASLKAMSSLSETERFRGYLARDSSKQDELVGLLEPEARTNPDAINILSAIGTESSISVLIDYLDSVLRQKEGVDTTVLEALMSAGERARALLITRHRDLIPEIDRVVMKTLREPYSYDNQREGAKDALADIYKKWLIFIGEGDADRRPPKRGSPIEAYLSQREKIADLIIKIRAHLANNPDMAYEEIMGFIEEDVKGLGLRSRARFRMGVINYVRDRERVCMIEREAAKHAIKSGVLYKADALNDPSRTDFVKSLIGFTPGEMLVHFLIDTIHIELDPESYGHIRYMQREQVSGRTDNYDQLTPSTKAIYRDSEGVFSPTNYGSVAGVGLSGLVTFESKQTTEKIDDYVLLHEVQHRFFHGYADDELKESLLSAEGDVDRLIGDINLKTGDKQRQAIEELIAAQTITILNNYQNEMLSKIADGKWIKSSGISSWFDYYKQSYQIDIQEALCGVGDKKLRQSMAKEVLARAEKMLVKFKPVIDRVIELKTQFIEMAEGIDHDTALKKANQWVAAFLLTIPVNRFDRLSWLISRLEDELEKKVPSQSAISTSEIAQRPDSRPLKAEPSPMIQVSGSINVAEEVRKLIDKIAQMDSGDEKSAALEKLIGSRDDRTISALAGVLDNHPDDEPDSQGIGLIAAYGLGRSGNAASPYIKTLLERHGPKRNILIAISELGDNSDEDFAELIKRFRIQDDETKSLAAYTLLTLGDKRGLEVLIDQVAAAVDDYDRSREPGTATLVEDWEAELEDERVSDLVGRLVETRVRDKVKEMLKADPLLECRLMASMEKMIRIHSNDDLMLEHYIDVLGLGSSSFTADILKRLYEDGGRKEAIDRAIARAMVEVGPACARDISHADARDNLMIEVLGDIKDASAVPCLLIDLTYASPGDITRQHKIMTAVEKIGNEALPYLMGTLENGRGDNRDICRLAARVESLEIISKVVDMLEDDDIPEKNKLNIVIALGEMELITHYLSFVMRQNDALRKRIFNAGLTFLSDGPGGASYTETEYGEIERVLKVTSTVDDVPQLIDAFNRRNVQENIMIKSAILNVMAVIDSDECADLILDAILSEDAETSDLSLRALDTLAKSGRLSRYLERDDKVEIASKLVRSLEGKLGANIYASSVLGAIGSRGSVAALARGLERKSQKDGTIDITLVEDLARSGREGATILLSLHPEFVASIDKAMTEELLAPYSSDTKTERYKDKLEEIFKRWLVFIGSGRTHKMAAARTTTKEDRRQKLFKTYFSQREAIADLIIKLKERLKAEPDMRYDEISGFIEDDLKPLSARAQARFRIGIINYVRDRERVRKVIIEAAKAGISDGGLLTKSDIETSAKKIEFVTGILGFMPSSMRIFFMTDTIHIVLDPGSYGRMQYRQAKGALRDADDNFDNLQPHEKYQYRDSGGIFTYNQRGKIGGIELSGLLTFEQQLPDGVERDGHTSPHETQHKFFSRYARDELKDAISRHRSRAYRLGQKINTQKGDKQAEATNMMISCAVNIILYEYQDEMMAKVIDGKWTKMADISGWVQYYKRSHMDEATGILNSIHDGKLRQDIADRIAARIEAQLNEHKPMIDRIIELKALLFARDEGMDGDAAPRKANEWTTAFLQTIPITKFDRLKWLVSRLEIELESDPYDPTKIANCEEEIRRGFSVLTQYSDYLNPLGIEARERLGALDEMVRSGSMQWSRAAFDECEKAIANVPTIRNPHDELFADPNLTDEQFDVLLHHGYDGSFNLQLTRGCGNQCLHCGIGENEGRMQHMPFPLAVKLLKKGRGQQQSVVLYFNSDPAHYGDKVVNANMADVVNTAKMFGYSDISIVTHLIGGSKNAETREVMSKTKTAKEISFHVFDRRVSDLIIRAVRLKSQPDVSPELVEYLNTRRTAIKDAYVSRFTAGIKGAIESGEKFEVRRIGFGTEANTTIRDNYPMAFKVFNIMNRLHVDVWNDVSAIIKQDHGIELGYYDDKGQYVFSGGELTRSDIAWNNRAVQWLREVVEKCDLGLGRGQHMNPEQETQFENVLRQLEDLHKKYHDRDFIEDHYLVQIRPADKDNGYPGSIALWTKEGESDKHRYRMTSEMFDRAKVFSRAGDDYKRFVSFIENLILLVRIDHTKTISSRKLTYYGFVGGGKFADQDELWKKKIESALSRTTIPYREKGILCVREDLADYFRILAAFFLPKDELAGLLEHPIANLEKIYELVSDAPFPITMNFYMQIDTADYLGPITSFSHEYLDSDHLSYKRNLYQTLRAYESPVKPFNRTVPDTRESGSENGEQSPLSSPVSSADPNEIPDYRAIAIASGVLSRSPLAKSGADGQGSAIEVLKKITGAAAVDDDVAKVIAYSELVDYAELTKEQGERGHTSGNSAVKRLKAIIDRTSDDLAKAVAYRRLAQFYMYRIPSINSHINNLGFISAMDGLKDIAKKPQNDAARAVACAELLRYCISGGRDDAADDYKDILTSIASSSQDDAARTLAKISQDDIEYVNNIVSGELPAGKYARALALEFLVIRGDNNAARAAIGQLQAVVDAYVRGPHFASDIDLRKDATCHALRREEDAGSRDPVAVIGIPSRIADELKRKKQNPAKFLNELKIVISRILGENGYGDPQNPHKLKLFFIEEKADDTSRNLHNVLSKIDPGQEVVVFSPRINGVQIEIDKRMLERLGNQYTVIQDAYSDIGADMRGYPDICARIAITRLIAWCKDAEANENDYARAAALSALTEYINEISGNTISSAATIGGLLIQIELLQIKPVNYKNFTAWRANTKAVMSSA